MTLLSWMRELVEGLSALRGGVRETLGYARDYTLGRGLGSDVTSNYPEVKPVLPARFRGHLFNDIDRCVGCKSCARACPIDCITIDTEMSEGPKMHLSRFDIDLSKCIYCGLCEAACPHDCLHMTGDYQIRPVNSVNGHGRRYLFRRRADQTGLRLTTADMENLHRITLAEPEISDEDRAFLAEKIEDPKGCCLNVLCGIGYYTPEEKARVQAAREEKKRQREAAQKAREAEAAAKAASAETPAPAAEGEAK